MAVQQADPVVAAGPAAALAAGDWTTAFALLRAEHGRRPLDPAGLDALARAAYGAGEFEAAITAWEELHARCLQAGDDVGAAAAAATVAVYLMMDTGLMAPVRAWIGRAERLLGDRAESPTHALVAMTRTYERFLSGDMVQARSWGGRSVAAGTRQGVAVAAALGRVAVARVTILDGAVEEGLALLDEAAVSVVSGELDPLATGMVFCELICALQGLAEHDRAEQWTQAMDRWRSGTAFGGINGRCRVHRAEVLRLRGSCAAAEEEALEACRELRPWLRREFGWPLTELGTIRLRRGDLPGAEEAFLEALEHGWDPEPGLALLRLAQGRADTAAALVADALAHPCAVPSKEWPPHGALRRAPLLAAQAEIALAAGDLPTARAAADELTGIAAAHRSAALATAAALARGRVALAAGDAAVAVGECERAVAGWGEVGAPYETAVARLVLADAHRRVGREVRADLEERAARAALDRLGVRPPAGPLPPRPDGPRAAFRLAGDVRTVCFAGFTVLLADLKGMHYLARLLAEPDREFHVLDLLGAEHGMPASAGRDDSGPVLDEQARAAYRRRLAEIDEDLAEAEALGDGGRSDRARADRDYLVRELAGAFGLGGRRRALQSPSERARASVGRTLRYTVARIAEHHPALADHLHRTVRTGTYCSYRPDPGLQLRWEL
ncbi:transcriptional regulator [Modestobacter versicolor]|uniref:transcriptional regulator n=1 Tax=Modestobacter versicolor TaxID=429133 RepID=UPI0034E04361